MHIVHVHIRVKSEEVEAFKRASLDNAENSVREPGVKRFDVLQQADDPARFVLNEVYVDKQAADDHKKTAHYARWRDTVADMMAEPRFGIQFTNAFPADDQW
jgi:quinol monooxygenase YgiN